MGIACLEVDELGAEREELQLEAVGADEVGHGGDDLVRGPLLLTLQQHEAHLHPGLGIRSFAHSLFALSLKIALQSDFGRFAHVTLFH